MFVSERQVEMVVQGRQTFWSASLGMDMMGISGAEADGYSVGLSTDVREVNEKIEY